MKEENLDYDKIDIFKSDIYSLGLIITKMMSLGFNED